MKEVFTHMLIPKKSDGFLPRLCTMCLFLFANFLVQAQDWVIPDSVNDERLQPLLDAQVMLSMFPSSSSVPMQMETFNAPYYYRELNQTQIL